MGAYVYRVTAKHLPINGGAQVAKYAYKPYWGDDAANRRMAFASGCFANTKIDTDYIAVVHEVGVAEVYGNPTHASTYVDDFDLSSERFPRIGTFYKVGDRWIPESELDAICKHGTGFTSFNALLNAAGNYRPTIRRDSFAGANVLSAAYDVAQAARGDARRAFS